MQKKTFTFLVGFYLFYFSCFLSFSQITQRQRINFDKDWKFHFGHTSNPEKDFNYSITKAFVKSGIAENAAIEPKFKDSQ